ncbi:Dimeric dUTPase, all-alpha-NTP-PPase (MazG) superfamily [Halobacillus karajensis]|uniref:dUTPase n=1 Tax=Halobacillus karajensis TaxID=195088 RepID=A0A024P6D0_9BACI|nr:dUTP diphosphatase [Halobacillus karajensis]CDQ18252.1 dUTPase [Halobacillus karajensis]CDQ24604.1 dUTPase [Halobacillus karajensis]CDQ29149.1 dUTPase [Halobacillus karajensis]SEI05759.1 Dimeric dUTPase, all-alpha-NTP-PPase (MazG) superfamily [Halobacillus karajensis]
MNWNFLYDMQRKLDEYIEDQHQIERGDKVEEKVLALLVELGELANETRCFKFWSKKGPSEKTVILEEYVDGVHFLLSLGLDLGHRYAFSPLKNSESVTKAFLRVYQCVETMRENRDKESYVAAFSSYLALGRSLGITEQELIEAYEKKNAINFERQDQGY